MAKALRTHSKRLTKKPFYFQHVHACTFHQLFISLELCCFVREVLGAILQVKVFQLLLALLSTQTSLSLGGGMNARFRIIKYDMF